MKKFSLEEFKKNPNRKVVTRDGVSVRIVCTDAKMPLNIVALIEQGDYDVVQRYPDNGICQKKENRDLFFDTVKKEGWINLFMHEGGPEAGVIYDTKEKADKNSDYGKNPRFVATIHITWEE